MSSPPSHKFWASANDWRPEFVILGANVETIPTFPPPPPVIISIDGLWGSHEWIVYPQPYSPEFPYLAWIPLCSSNSAIPSNILTQSVHKSMWRAHPDHSNFHVINTTLLKKLTHKWTSIKAAIQIHFKQFLPNHPFLLFAVQLKHISGCLTLSAGWRRSLELGKTLWKFFGTFNSLFWSFKPF